MECHWAKHLDLGLGWLSEFHLEPRLVSEMDSRWGTQLVSEMDPNLEPRLVFQTDLYRQTTQGQLHQHRGNEPIPGCD